jgi:hypothetical protein
MKAAIQILMFTAALSGCRLYGEPNEAPPPIPAQEVPEVLNQGPIHEAFAQPLDLAPQAGIISPEEPPADIIEDPAAEKPKGSEYVWIPGYWAWDTERKDYVWVSGCWRVPPVGMSWIPGYWNKVQQGWQWVAGFWTVTSEADQIQYLPPPPELTDVEPPEGYTNTDEIWVPPCYYWRDSTYILRAGYWLRPLDNWVWIPSHYSWTPYGYVFVQGYWDHVLPARGVLYAPIYFPRRFYRPAGYTYSLGFVVDVGNLEFSLFSYPRYCHYFFGDYYNDFYVGLGIYPWYEFEIRHTWYDPIYEYDRCHYRDIIPHWDEHVRREYAMRRTNANLRPPRTYRELENRFSRTPARERSGLRMVESIQSYAERRNAPFKFSRLSSRQHQSIITHANEVNNFRRQRRELESRQFTPSAVQQSRETGVTEQIRPEQNRSAERPSASTRSERPSESVRSRGTEQTGERQHSAETEQRTERPQAREAERSQATERPAERAPAERQRYENRRSSERMNFPRSPISGQRSGGLFGQRTPSRPERESGQEHQREGGEESRDAGGGRGGRDGRRGR